MIEPNALNSLNVFPTSVGMNRITGSLPSILPGVPHKRGDEPRRTEKPYTS